MSAVFLFLMALFAFSLSSRGLIMAIVENVVIEKYLQPYSIKALKVGKAYKVAAWLLLTAFLFTTTVQSFLVVFHSL